MLLKMKGVIGFMLLSAIGVVNGLETENCGTEWFVIEMSHCKTEFVKTMNSSANALNDCPTFYKEAQECFKTKIVEECFKVNSTENQKKIESLRKEFGDEEHFCTYGFLPTMKLAMEGINLEECIDKKHNNYTVCEAPFRKAFREEFGNSEKDLKRLSKEFAESTSCQSDIARSCRIQQTADTYHFFETLKFDPYNPNFIERVSDAANKIEHGENIRSNSTMYIAVAIVGICLVVGIVVAGLYLWRRDNDRAEIRRRKSASKAQPKDTQAQQSEQEMQPLSQSAAVASPDDQVSPA